MASLIKHLCVIFFRFQYLYMYDKSKIKRFMKEAGLLIVSWCMAVLVMWVFTEKIPLAVVPTLFITKYFKYVLLITLIWTVETFSSLVEKGKYIAAYAILFFAFANHNWRYELIAYFVLIACLCYMEYKRGLEEEQSLSYGIVWGLIFVAIGYRGTFYEFSKSNYVVILIVLLLGFIYIMYEKYRNRFYYVCLGVGTLVLAVASLYGGLYWIDDGKIVRQTGENFICTTMGNDLYELAIAFNDNTDIGDTFLADSNDHMAGWVQIKSQRSVWATIHAVPSSKASTGEWYRRCVETEGLLDKPVEDIAEIMDKEEIEYILVNSAYYEKIDSYNGLECFVTVPGDSYRMYSRVID